MGHGQIAAILAEVFAVLPKTYAEVKYALDGDESFRPPLAGVRKALYDLAREAGKSSSGYLIQKAFDPEPEFIRDLALAAAASYAKKAD